MIWRTYNRSYSGTMQKYHSHVWWQGYCRSFRTVFEQI